MAPNKEKKYVSDNTLLMAEWDWEKNIESPYSITYGSAKVCFWKCSVCGYCWKTPAYSRGSNGCGCPQCAQKIRGTSKKRTSAKKNSFLSNYPEIAKEWHPTKNQQQKIEELSSFSNSKVWWLCSSCGNEWETTVNHRTKEHNACPVCAKIRGGIAKTTFHAQVNNFAKNYPDLAMEWHPTKNIKLTAHDISSSSSKKVWWKCVFCSHEWKSTINHRTNGRGCPKCSKAGTSRCEQVVYFYIQKVFPDAINRYRQEHEFDIYIPSHNIAIEYDGFFFHQNNHVFERDNQKDLFCKKHGIKLIRFRSPRLRDTICAERITCEDLEIEEGVRQLFSLLNMPCPTIDLDNDMIKVINNFRATRTQNSILNLYPEIAKEWHHTKNGAIPIDSVFPMSNTKFWWKCSECDYEWMDTPNHRCGRNSGCPFCAGKVVTEGINDLSTKHPSIAKEWNYERNGELMPTQVSAQSNKKVWWKCAPHHHEWQAAISDRTRANHRTSCPYCGNKKVLTGFNDLQTTHPHLALEWNEKNTISPTELTHGSSKRVWWTCHLCEHEWQAVVYSRSTGNGCPECRKNKQRNK